MAADSNCCQDGCFYSIAIHISYPVSSFQVKHGLVATLSKKGTDNLVVSNITIDTKAPDSKKNKESGDKYIELKSRLRDPATWLPHAAGTVSRYLD